MAAIVSCLKRNCPSKVIELKVLIEGRSDTWMRAMTIPIRSALGSDAFHVAVYNGIYICHLQVIIFEAANYELNV